MAATTEASEGAALADRATQILINTNGHPLTSDVDGVPTQTVLGSYGLFVSDDGLLMSPANEIAPTRGERPVGLAAAGPDKLLCGYMNSWFLSNGAADSLLQLPCPPTRSRPSTATKHSRLPAYGSS
ncbi:MAG: hypothetical protein R2716_13785 [Microthrixaceae bacterium]